MTFYKKMGGYGPFWGQNRRFSTKFCRKIFSPSVTYLCLTIHIPKYVYHLHHYKWFKNCPDTWRYDLTHWLTPASLRGGHNDPPLEKNSATLSFVIYFAPRFLRKKMNGRRKFCHKKKFEKKYLGGSPESPNLTKI